MAQNKKNGFLSKMLELIGLTEDGYEDKGSRSKDETDAHQAQGRPVSKNPRFGDEFDDEPKMSRPQPKRPAASANGKSGFDFDESWDELSSRPDYGARTQQRAQSKNRQPAGRYGSEQRGSSNMNERNNGRYEGASGSDRYYRGNGAYHQDEYRSSAQRGHSAYGASSGRYEEPAYGDPYSDEQYGSRRSSEQKPAQRHQTIIFKLHSVDECKGVIMALIEKNSVLLNLDELDSMQAQRTLDIMSGATFAIGATLSRASDRTWLITPSTVDVKDNPVDQPTGGYRSRYSI